MSAVLEAPTTTATAGRKPLVNNAQLLWDQFFALMNGNETYLVVPEGVRDDVVALLGKARVEIGLPPAFDDPEVTTMPGVAV